jgi:tRNA (guanine-N7-)-methyltransferase
MSKKKLQRFAENQTFPNLFQPSPQEMYEREFELKGCWNKNYFHNENPIVVEFGCGKGEYTIGLAQKYPDKNFIGVDIKGARLWRGCKTAHEAGLKNAAFVRNKIEFVNSLFAAGEVSEIWITFPDPQPKKPKKRLTSSRFLSHYAKLLKPGGIIHLKTDNEPLHIYTLDILKHNNLELLFASDDLYHSGSADEILSIQTFYEKQFLAKGMKITYLKFKINQTTDFFEPIEVGKISESKF